MAREPELSIKVKVDPQIKPDKLKSAIEKKVKDSKEIPEIEIKPDEEKLLDNIKDALEDLEVPITPKIDTEKLKADLKTEIDKITDLPEVNIGVNVDDFSDELSKRLKEELKAVNEKLSYYLKNLTTNTAGLNSVVEGLFPSRGISNVVQSELKSVQAELTAGLKGVKSKVKPFKETDLFQIGDTESTTTIRRVEKLVKNIRDQFASLDNFYDADEEKFLDGFNSEFEKFQNNTSETVEKLSALKKNLSKDKFSDLLDNEDFDTESTTKALTPLISFLKKLSTTSIKTGEDYDNLYALFNNKNTNKLFDESNDHLTRMKTRVGDITAETKTAIEVTGELAKVLNKAIKDDNSGYLSDAEIKTYGAAFDEVLSNIATKQEEINTKKQRTVELENDLLTKTRSNREALKQELEEYKNLLKSFGVKGDEDEGNPKGKPKPKSKKPDKTPSQKPAEEPKAENQDALNNGIAKIQAIVFDINQEELQKSIDTIFAKVSAPIGFKPANGAIANIKQQLQEAFSDIEINTTNVNLQNSKTENTSPKYHILNKDELHKLDIELRMGSSLTFTDYKQGIDRFIRADFGKKSGFPELEPHEISIELAKELGNAMKSYDNGSRNNSVIDIIKKYGAKTDNDGNIIDFEEFVKDASYKFFGPKNRNKITSQNAARLQEMLQSQDKEIQAYASFIEKLNSKLVESKQFGPRAYFDDSDSQFYYSLSPDEQNAFSNFQTKSYLDKFERNLHANLVEPVDISGSSGYYFNDINTMVAEIYNLAQQRLIQSVGDLSGQTEAVKDQTSIPGKVTITDADVIVDVKNPVTIPGTVTVDPTSVQLGNSDDLQKNASALSSVKQSLNKISTSAEDYGTKIAAIGPSVQYVAQEVDNLSKSLENQITDLDLIAKKTDAYGTTANSITLNSKDVAAPTAPVDIPGKVTLKVEDVTPPKGSVKIPGKVELKVLDITPPKTAIKLEGIPETPNHTKPSETLDDYRDSVGAAAGIQEYFAKEVDNATAALGSQSETLKALKKSLDEYIGSIDGVEKFAKAEKELDRLKKKLAQQQQQQPAQPAPQQPNNQPLAPIKPNSNPKPNNNGYPPAPPTPSNNRPPNNGGNNGGNNSPVESQRKLEQSLERIMTKIITSQNKKDTSGDKGYEKNVAEQVKWQSQLQDQAEELIDKLNANYPGWEKGKSWQRHGERIAHARNDYSTAREDKQDADYVKDITSQYSQLESLYKRRVSLFKPDQVDNLRDIDDEIKGINSDLAKTYAEAKQNGYDLTGNSDIQESIDSLSREKKISKRDFAKNQQQYNNAQIENLFDEYERLTSKLQTYGQRRASSIGNDNVQAQSNVLRDYINTQTELNKLESEFKNRGFLKAGSAEWQQTYDLMEKRKDLEKAVEFEVNNRIQAEQEAIRVQDEDRISLLAYIKTIEKYKDTLEKDGKTDSSVYGKSVSMSNAGWDLLSELNKNPDNKDQVAYLWGQKYNIQGVTDLESAFKALAVEAAKAGIEVQDLRTETEKLRAVTQAKTNIANLKSQLIDYLEKFPKVGKALAEPVQKLQEAFADPNAYKNAGQLKQAMAELRAQAKSLGLESENLIDKFEKLFGQHLSTMITMAALHKMQDALRIVYQNVVEIDTAVTELRKVSEYAGKSLEEYMGRAAEQAQKLGVSISDYVNSTADWKRLGYSDEDAENLATYSTLLKNVGDNIDDVNTSSSYLISTLQGFGLLADQAEDVVNKIDAVANTQPVTAKDLGEILTRSSAAMSAANNTLEETIALGTAANSVLQDADSVGTMMKSLSMYLRAAKSDAENAGIEVDGMANSVSELRSELKSLTGVDIMLDSKNFKSTYQIMKELSQVWSGLSDVTQANVTEMIGGKRNANAVSAILNNFDVAESAMESAANSANVAWEENEKWLDSIQGRLGQLDASFQVLSQDVLSSGLVKTGVSFLTSIVKLLDKIINLTGALPAGLGIAAFATQLGEPKMTGFMIVPSNTPGGDTEQVLRRHFIISLRSMREYLVKPTNMVA